MAYICSKKIKCQDCVHYRYDPDSGRPSCWVKYDELHQNQTHTNNDLYLNKFYNERTDFSQNIITKLKTGVKLNPQETKYVIDVLLDPLNEFCTREGVFRLIEILNQNIEWSIQHAEEAAEVVRDCIDYDENLYDKMDATLREEIIEKKGGEE